jgi:hypothetical protein
MGLCGDEVGRQAGGACRALQGVRRARRPGVRPAYFGRRSRSQSCATRCEEMCQGHEERGVDRSERRSRRSPGGARHAAGGSGKAETAARRLARLARRAAGGPRDLERGPLRSAIGVLLGSVPEGRSVPASAAAFSRRGTRGRKHPRAMATSSQMCVFRDLRDRSAPPRPTARLDEPTSCLDINSIASIFTCARRADFPA